MKKNIFILILFTFFSACRSDKRGCLNLKKGEVCVKIINDSDYVIKNLELKYSGGTSTISNLKNEDEEYITVYSPGEGSYIITAVFEDNKIIKSHGNYIEGGYVMTETIRRDKIESKFGEQY